MIAWALTPKVVFYAANRRDLQASFSTRSSQVIAMRTNETLVSQAFEYAFASQGNKKLFVAKHLCPSSPAGGNP